MTADYVRAVEDGDGHVVCDAGVAYDVVVTRACEDHLLIENIVVAPALQSRGLGGRILDWAEARAESLGYDEARLFTHEKMVEDIEFYLRYGFELTRVAEEDSFPRVHFRKACPSG